MLNDDQTAMIIASQNDCIYYDISINNIHNLDEMFEISNIKQVRYDKEDRSFYLLANQYQERLGCFMIRFHEDFPDQWKFLI